MKESEARTLAALPLILLIAAAIAWAGSQGGRSWHSVPAFALGAATAFALNWLAFVPAYLRQTERFYDLTGSLTYLALVLLALATGPPDSRTLLLALLVTVWALRLGSFLFTRIRREGADRRFDAIKPSWPRFLLAWTLQALWVLVTLSCALAAMTSPPQPLGASTFVGTLVWITGFSLEAIADEQKRRFRRDAANAGRFIRSGLWAWSRHPNYFGEIVLWIGIALIALPALSGWQHLTLISPVFVYVLLTRISGVPMLERRAEKAWGTQPEYRAYRDSTPVLVPRPPHRSP